MISHNKIFVQAGVTGIIASMKENKLYIGAKVGRWTLLKKTWKVVGKKNPSRKSAWHCICECGGKGIILSTRLKNGRGKSCGCLSAELAKKRFTKHGMYKSPEYSAWRHMIERCCSKNNKRFGNYGGRGIKVYDGWLNSFETFLEDMGKRPSDKHSLDRIDNNGNYEPTNCKWSTRREQDNNRTNTLYITYQDHTATLRDWAEHLQISYQTLFNRLYTYNWSIRDSFETPVKRRK